jgi:small-conductance mechanosensitive channel
MKEKLLAQVDLGRIGGENGFGPFGNLNLDDVSEAATDFTRIISNAIGVMTIVAGIWFVFMFVTGAFSFLTAGGDSKKMGEASGKIGSALIGLVVVVLAYALISLIGNLLGFEILNPQNIIESLSPTG